MWQRITTTRYTRALEAEVARERAENERLRAENRALLNSILGIAGVPPLPVVSAPPSTSPLSSSPPIGTDVASPPPPQASPKQGASVAIPMRRRSWQQINRMLEFESTKKKESNVSM
jgi:hypothetical protein